MNAPLRLRLDAAALCDNWRALDRASGRAACGAAVKADGYGLGSVEVARRLAQAGCRDFFVATWAEAERLAPLGLTVSVLHGVRADDAAAALSGVAWPVLNTEAQVARWREMGGRPCDVMVDTGMNRLGVSPQAVRDGLLDGLAIETLMSHLACADEDGHPLTPVQRARFAGLAGRTGARRMSLANSAGIALGPDYAFDLTRPGLALYGGVPRADMTPWLRQVVFPEAEVLQRRHVAAGESVGYNATWVAPHPCDVAILNIGYADGYGRGFSDRGHALWRGERLAVIGRVSMDLVAVDVTGTGVGEGDWVGVDYALPGAAVAGGRSQYELLTGLGARFTRHWA